MAWNARAQKHCDLCHRLYWPRSSAQRVCNDPACRARTRTQEGRRKLGRPSTRELKLPQQRRCIVCGKFFTKSLPMRVRRGARLMEFENLTCAKTCSVECRKRHAREVMDRVQDSLRKRWRVSGRMYELRLRPDGFWVDGYGNRHKEKNCEQCGKLSMMRIGQHYCGKRCMGIAHRTAPPDRPKGAYWVGTVRLNCQTCGASFWGKPAKRKFCSRLCANIPKRLHRTKEQIAEIRRARLREYRANPIVRERRKEEHRAYRIKMAADPIRMERRRELARIARAEQRRRWLDNPQGEKQWLLKSRHELNRIRRMLSEGLPLSPKASASPRKGSTPPSNSQP